MWNIRIFFKLWGFFVAFLASDNAGLFLLFFFLYAFRFNDDLVREARINIFV